MLEFEGKTKDADQLQLMWTRDGVKTSTSVSNTPRGCNSAVECQPFSHTDGTAQTP